MRGRVAVLVVWSTSIAYGCASPNAAFDPLGASTDATAGGDATSTATMGATMTTTTTTPDGDGPDDASEASDTAPETSDDGSEGRDETSGGLNACALPQTPAMHFAIDVLDCGTWTTAEPQRGFIEMVGPGMWAFFACGESTCSNACTPWYEVLFDPPASGPAEAMHGRCVQLDFDREPDAVSQECLPRWTVIRDDVDATVWYASGWALPGELLIDALPFVEMTVGAKCSCEVDDVACCPDGEDTGPYAIVVQLEDATVLSVPPGEVQAFQTPGAQGLIAYEIGNHRALRDACGERALVEWFVRRTDP